jgi:hypothetical protein
MMKALYSLFLVLLLGALLTACSASTANIQSADLGTGFADNSVTGPTTTFAANAPMLHCVTKVANVPDGTTVRAVWTAVTATDASGTAIKDQQICEKTTPLAADGAVDFTLSVPTSGVWPAGSYKVDLYLNDKLDRTLTFTIQ